LVGGRNNVRRAECRSGGFNIEQIDRLSAALGIAMIICELLGVTFGATVTTRPPWLRLRRRAGVRICAPLQ
jgi:hypothetical protein